MYDVGMRTTLDLDLDVLQAAREIGAAHGRTIGQVVSDLVRKALTVPGAPAKIRNGVPVLPKRAATAPRPTMALVNSLRDD